MLKAFSSKPPLPKAGGDGNTDGAFCHVAARVDRGCPPNHAASQTVETRRAGSVRKQADRRS